MDFSPLLKVLGGPDSSLWSDKWSYQWLCGIFQCLENLSLSIIFASSAALPDDVPATHSRFRFGSQNLKFFQKFEHIICGKLNLTFFCKVHYIWSSDLGFFFRFCLNTNASFVLLILAYDKYEVEIYLTLSSRMDIFCLILLGYFENWNYLVAGLNFYCLKFGEKHRIFLRKEWN